MRVIDLRMRSYTRADRPQLAALLLDGSRPLQETACNMEALLKIQRIFSNLEIPLQPYETPSAAAERALLQQVAICY